MSSTSSSFAITRSTLVMLGPNVALGSSASALMPSAAGARDPHSRCRGAVGVSAGRDELPAMSKYTTLRERLPIIEGWTESVQLFRLRRLLKAACKAVVWLRGIARAGAP